MKKLLLVFGFVSVFTGLVVAQTEHPARPATKAKTEKHHKKAVNASDSAHVKNTAPATKKTKKN